MTTNVTPPVGLSVWEHDLFVHLTEHMSTEQGLVEEYSKLAENAGGHVKYLLDLIIEDEMRHHRLFEEWCNALKATAEFREVAPQIPHLTPSEDPEEVRRVVRMFLEVERVDGKELERLQKMLKSVKDTTVWTLLVDLMELDTKKHQTILRFLEKHPG